jgi:hypothetical protein
VTQILVLTAQMLAVRLTQGIINNKHLENNYCENFLPVSFGGNFNKKAQNKVIN